uniref:LAGLIDADG homing endonuclease n=1 Tax=Tephrocybe rancida TaxID=117070 RepID=A0A386TY94_9AGAR|nr:LAGLIDADG homing endonuclease [Tephrocybe rancida]AYE93172.1 LAGLIDADG homing endonuclease [Tephrocybe rancida]
MPALNLAVCWDIFYSLFNYIVKDNQQVTLITILSEWNLNDCAPGLSIDYYFYCCTPLPFSSFLRSSLPPSSPPKDYFGPSAGEEEGGDEGGRTGVLRREGGLLVLPSGNDRREERPPVSTYRPFLCLGSYLAGLIEGDGSINIPSTQRSSVGKLNYPSIQIVFQAKDFPLVAILCRLIGEGSISKKKQSAAYIYTINSLQGIVTLVQLINGKIRGGKHNKLNKLIDYINNKTSSSYGLQPRGLLRPGLILEKLPLDTSPLQNNGWLAGFIEADGCFQVRTSLTSKQRRLGISFELSQARITQQGYSTLEVMEMIASFLKISVNNIRGERKHPQYRIRTSSLRSNQILRDYLEKYPLYGSKLQDYKDWCQILSYFEMKTHYQNVDNICKIKSQMNQYRTVFLWDHLV